MIGDNKRKEGRMEGRKDGWKEFLFNDALSTFYFWLYG